MKVLFMMPFGVSSFSATIKIKASKNPAFKAGKALKDAVN